MKKEYRPFLDNRERLFETRSFYEDDGFPVLKVVSHSKRVYVHFDESTPKEIEGLNKLIFET